MAASNMTFDAVVQGRRVVAGEALDRVRAGDTEPNLAGAPHSRELRIHGQYAGAHRERQVEIAKQLSSATGVERDRLRRLRRTEAAR